MNPILRYSMLRLTLLVAVALGVWAVGARGVVWALITLVVSATLSYLLLRRARDEAAQVIERRVSKPGRFDQQVAADARDEDEDADALRKRDDSSG